VIISEYPTGTPLSQNNLVERNRLQAGLSDAVILVQTDIKKGGKLQLEYSK
jgi:DNA processing protein